MQEEAGPLLPPLFGEIDPPPALTRLAATCRQLGLPHRTTSDMTRVLRELGCDADAECSLEEVQRRADQLVPRNQEVTVQELQRAIGQLKARLPRPAHQKNDAAAAPPTLVRQCRDAGVALVPCDPMGDTCPPDDRLRGTPYQDMYSVLGSGATQFTVRCVPPEMVRLSQVSAPKEALTVEQQERRLDQRLHAALGAVERAAPNADRLAGWTTRAPCGALAGSERACARMRFSNADEGGRCLYSGPAGQCHDNLVETRKKVDAASMRIIQLVRRVRQRLQHLVRSTEESSVEEALALVARGMEQQAHAEHVCSMYHKKEEQCVDAAQRTHAGTACTFDSVNQTCTPFSCSNLDEKTCKTATHGQQGGVCHWDRLQDPPRCRPARACADHGHRAACGMDNQCMWTGNDCRDGVDAVYHLMNVVDRAEKQYGAHGTDNVHRHLADELVDHVMSEDTGGSFLQLRRDTPETTLTTPAELEEAAARHRLGPAYVARLKAEMRRTGAARLAVPYQAEPEHPPGVQGGGGGPFSPERRKAVAGVVKVMAHALRQYNRVLRLGAALRREGGAAFQSALRLDAACRGGGAGGEECAAPGRHRATRRITWDRDRPSRSRPPPPAAASTAHAHARANAVTAFEDPVLELEPEPEPAAA